MSQAPPASPARQRATEPSVEEGTSVVHDHDRKWFLRDSFAGIARRAGDRPIALYGAGRHTCFLLDALRGMTDPPRIRFILDDAAEQVASIQGVPVISPRHARASEIACVVISSDTIEDVLAERAHQWLYSITDSSDFRPEIIRLYGTDPVARIGAHSDAYRGAWGLPGAKSTEYLPLRPGHRILRLATTGSTSGDAGISASGPLPPPALRAGYCVDDDARYLQSGRDDVTAIRAFIERTAPGFAPRRVLDWGCSSGRLIRHWADLAAAGGEVWGVDLCAAAINWAAENLAPPFRFVQCTTRPHLPFPDASLDLVYANSVFTHIRDLWDAWLMELRRNIRPGGLLFVTILDEHSWEWIGANPGNGIANRCPGIDFSIPLTDDFVAHGFDTDVVSFWHSSAVRRRWAFAFDVLGFQHGVVPYQTGVLLRRPL